MIEKYEVDDSKMACCQCSNDCESKGNHDFRLCSKCQQLLTDEVNKMNKMILLSKAVTRFKKACYNNNEQRIFSAMIAVCDAALQLVDSKSESEALQSTRSKSAIQRRSAKLSI